MNAVDYLLWLRRALCLRGRSSMSRGCLRCWYEKEVMTLGLAGTSGTAHAILRRGVTPARRGGRRAATRRGRGPSAAHRCPVARRRGAVPAGRPARRGPGPRRAAPRAGRRSTGRAPQPSLTRLLGVGRSLSVNGHREGVGNRDGTKSSEAETELFLSRTCDFFFF